MLRCTWLLCFLTAGVFLLASCKKDEPSTGNLNLTVTLNNNSNFGNYALYTEAGYTASATPLRQGLVAYSKTAGTVSTGVVVLNELAPGNYIVTVYGRAISAQITAGQTSYLSQAL